MERRGGQWWTADAKGEWRVWNEAKSIWEPSPIPPPPTESAVVVPKAPLRVGPRRVWLVALLSLALASDVAGALSRLVGTSVFERIATLEDAPARVAYTLAPDLIADANALDTRDRTIGWLQLGAYLGTAIAFIVWLFAVYRNLGHLGVPNYRFKPGWAIGGWFVPFLNLVRPKQIVDDAWRGSDPDVGEIHDVNWHKLPVSPLLHWWWAAFIISGFAGNIYAQIALPAETLANIRTAYAWGLWSDVLGSIAGILAIVLVVKLSRRQGARASALGVVL